MSGQDRSAGLDACQAYLASEVASGVASAEDV